MTIDSEAPKEVRIAAILEQVRNNASRIKELGQWPAHIQEDSLAERIPKQGGQNAPGFDAGIACALDLIARDKQRLSAIFHGAYTPEAVQQVREELKNDDPNSETVWWLAACSICDEDRGVDQDSFLKQINDFETLQADPKKRAEAAKSEFKKMSTKFSISEELGGVPYGTVDGCMQGAYLAGYLYATSFNEKYGLYFIGTYEASLGLEDFKWSEEKDGKGKAKSGPVWGSNQFVKCATKEELLEALKIVKGKFKK